MEDEIEWSNDDFDWEEETHVEGDIYFEGVNLTDQERRQAFRDIILRNIEVNKDIYEEKAE